ncbi:hypothetical protein phiGrn1_0376 [Vibrio phage phi-Grn1]|uniref:Uncharacterized protein n=1 Tax=Vibrio phage phi-Grn1 TaxID=1747713 RepID=A0A126HGV4_9CAUD|nr:hypothetical protein phiGrn1_0376 [Vibrio phage phi-Grn1]
MKKLTALSLLLLSSVASANVSTNEPTTFLDDVQVRLGGWSYHLSGDGYCPDLADKCKTSVFKEYNETNNAIGVRYKNWEVMTLENSFYERSFVAGYHFTYTPSKEIDYDLFLGLATGYTEVYDLGILPAIQPSVTYWATDNLGAELGLLMGSDIWVPVVTMSFKARF